MNDFPFFIKNPLFPFDILHINPPYYTLRKDERKCMMKSYLLRLWNIIDPLYFKCSRLCYVPKNEPTKTVLRVRLTRYQGRSAILRDGTTVQKGDMLLKIHLHNVRLIHELQIIDGDLRKAAHLYHSIKQALFQLAKEVETYDEYRRIKAIIGVTSLYQGAERLGFDIVPIKNYYYRLFKKCTFLLIDCVAHSPRNRAPVYLFMSKNQLMNKYMESF